jgi:hypothetical protein
MAAFADMESVSGMVEPHGEEVAILVEALQSRAAGLERKN